MLDGSYPMSVDAKLRVTLPATMRKEMGKAVKLLPFKDCVYGFTPESLDSWIELFFERRGGYDPGKVSDQRLMRNLRGSVASVEIDSVGRIGLGRLDASKSGILEKLGVMGDVAIVGNGDHFEIWNADAWAAEQAEFEDDFTNLFFHD